LTKSRRRRKTVKFIAYAAVDINRVVELLTINMMDTRVDDILKDVKEEDVQSSKRKPGHGRPGEDGQ
jgi:hypothetical protein